MVVQTHNTHNTPAHQHTLHARVQHSTALSSWSISTRQDTLWRLPNGCQIPPPWFAGPLVWRPDCPGCQVGTRWGTIRLGSPTLTSSLVFPILSLLRCFACVLAHLLACLACLSCLPAWLLASSGLGLLAALWTVACGLWPGQQLSQICILDSLVCQFMRPSSRNTKSRIDRETGWGRGSQAARLQIATPHSSTAATANGPRPAAPRCWVSIPAATNTIGYSVLHAP